MPLLAPLSLAVALATAPRGRADEAAVKAADAAMSEASQRRDLDGFLAHVAEDAIFAGDGGLADGKAAVRERWAPLFAPDGPSLTWAPERAVVAASGDLAFTVGRYSMTHCERPSQGRYVTVWRKVGGGWQALLDAPNRPATALGPGLRRTPVRSVRSRAGDLEASAGSWQRDLPSSGAREEGTFLTIRRRAHAVDWQPVVDAASAARR